MSNLLKRRHSAIALIAAMLVLSLGACGTALTQADRDHAWQICGSKFDDQARNQCLQHQYRIQAARHQDEQDNAAILLLGGTAFVNGYNAGGDHPLPMTNYGGHVTMWGGGGGMLQGY